MGQNCIGIERMLVHSSQYDELHAIFNERIARLRVGPVLAPSPEGYVSTIDSGSMISSERFEALERIIRGASEAGAIVLNGTPYNHMYAENGCYFSPTLVGAVDTGMDIAQQERK